MQTVFSQLICIDIVNRKKLFYFLREKKIKLVMDSSFRRLYSLADNYDHIVDFTNFCENKYNFVNCDIKNCRFQFFIEMLTVFLERKGNSI